MSNKYTIKKDNPMVTLDLPFIRNQFPAFSEPSLKGWAFFENAGGSYTCQPVINRLTEFYTKTKVQPYYAYPASQAAGEAMDESYNRLSQYLNVAEEEVHFGPSTTQNLYVLAHAFAALWQKGDEIICSNQDHEANAGYWRQLEKFGIIIKEWSVDADTGMLNPSDLDHLLNKKTRLLAFPHCSNVIGHINPVAKIVKKCKAFNIITVVDGVSYAPHGLPDIKALGADIYLFSLYKTWGPHLGLMTIKREILDILPNQGHYFNACFTRKKLLPAGPDHAQIAAACGVAEYLDTVYQHHFSEDTNPAKRGIQLQKLFKSYETSLLSYLLEWLKEQKKIRIIGPTDPELRAPTVSIVPKEKSIEAVFTALTSAKLMVGCGHFYAVRPLQKMNISNETGLLRLSFVHYTSKNEIEQLIEGLDIALNRN